MVKKAILFLAVALGIAGGAQAQFCGTSEQQAKDRQMYPQIAEVEAQIKQEMKRFDLLKSLAKTTLNDDTTIFHIPVVVHVIHDYGTSNYFTDNEVYKMMEDINIIYRKENADLAEVIAPFKPYIGDPKIQFHLATRDPLGRPTKGITHRQSYLTQGGDNQAKFDLWAPDAYVNIWIIDHIGRGTAGGFVAAYATPPSSAAVLPYVDGVIGRALSANANKTIAHELGHILNLIHPWGEGAVGTACGDDEVNDTPPTTGHFGNNPPFGPSAHGDCNSSIVLYDTTCIHSKSSVSKILLDTAVDVADVLTDRGIEFFARTGLKIDSVDVYPDVLNQPFEIKLLRANSSRPTGYDTLYTRSYTTAYTGSKFFQAQGVLTSFDLTPDVNKYKMVLTVNPGMKRDTANAVFSKTIPAVIDITGADADNRYNYFYNWRVTYGYVANGIDYPDTVNTQNIMDYADCPRNFTKGQVVRMREALESSAGNRNLLVKKLNALKTGIAVLIPQKRKRIVFLYTV